MQTFETPGSVLATVSCPAGEVTVESTDDHRTEVDVVALRDDEATREAVAGTLVELRPRGDGHELVVEVPKNRSRLFGRDAKVGIRLRVPHGSDLAVTSASADVRATGRYGQIRTKTASGDLTVDEVAELRADSASGDVRADSVGGDARIRTASGDVRLGRVGGALSATAVSGDVVVRSAANGGSVQAVSGDVELGAVRQGDVDVRTVSGDVTVGIETGSRVHVDVTTVSGDLRSAVELGDSPADGDGPMVEVRGRTVSGDFAVGRSRIAASA